MAFVIAAIVLGWLALGALVALIFHTGVVTFNETRAEAEARWQAGTDAYLERVRQEAIR